MDIMQCMAIFRRVVETENFSAVARETNMSQSTVSKHVAALEKRLDTKLLNRSTRAFKLTDAGQEYYRHCIRLINDFQEAEASVGKGMIKPTGILRLSSCIAFGQHFILPKLQSFLTEFSEIEIELLFSDDYVDLVKEGIDLAIRIGPLADSSLIAKKIGSSQRVVVASPDYLVKHSRPKKPMALTKHNCLLYTQQKTPDLWIFNSLQAGEETVRVNGKIKLSSPDAVCKSAVEGLGIALMCKWLVNDYIAEGKLIVILENYNPTPYAIHAIYPERRFVAQKVKRMIEYLSNNLAANNS